MGRGRVEQALELERGQPAIARRRFLEAVTAPGGARGAHVPQIAGAAHDGAQQGELAVDGARAHGLAARRDVAGDPIVVDGGQGRLGAELAQQAARDAFQGVGRAQILRMLEPMARERGGQGEGAARGEGVGVVLGLGEPAGG